jgi:hypothetical protein
MGSRIHALRPRVRLSIGHGWVANSQQLLDDILDQMPQDMRTVFTLFEFEDLTGPEIAQVLGIPLGTVASRLRRAREYFRVEVRRFEALSNRSLSALRLPSFPGHVLCAGMR